MSDFCLFSAKKNFTKSLDQFFKNDKLDNVASEKTTLENSLKNISNLLLTESSKPVKLTKSLFGGNVIRVKALLKLRKKVLKSV
ncbi:hypothetical protein DWV91_12235 [Enterococcus asini]|nr:hypothetical protein DWV91_12235 [Enterococcus asini]